MAREWADARVIGTEVIDERKLDGKVLLRHRYRTAFLTIDDGDRRPPIALPGDAPVMEPVLHPRSGEAAFGEPRNDLPGRITTGHAIEGARVHQRPVFGHAWQRFPRCLDNLANRELELRRELEVPLVVCRHGHDRAGAVLHENVIGDPDWDRLARGRIAGVGSDEHPRLCLIADAPRHNVL